MQAGSDALAFAPPPEPAAVRGFVLAVIAHLLLVVALSLGINWDKETAPASVEAELWSALPQEAAPPPPPAPQPQPQPEPQPKVVQPPPPVVQPAPPPPVAKPPDIAIEREKKRKEQEARRREEDEQRRKLEAQKRKAEEQQRLADEKKQREELAKKDRQKKEVEAKKLEQLRKENLARMMAEATGSGAPTSQGTAARASGPSDSYAGRIRARVKPNIVFSEDAAGNPSAEVEVRMSPDGTIVSRKVTKSSGMKSWDDAVLRALDKTEVLPRDVDGRVHTPLIIAFKLRD
jgi:colicin import membrane protein